MLEVPLVEIPALLLAARAWPMGRRPKDKPQCVGPTIGSGGWPFGLNPASVSGSDLPISVVSFITLFLLSSPSSLPFLLTLTRA